MEKIVDIKNDCRNFDTEYMINTILESRGVLDIDDDIENFLHPGINYIANPFDLKNMDKAADILIECMKNNGDILIWGDVDTDGCTSASIVYNGLLGLNVFYSDHLALYINDGKEHGITDWFLETNKNKYDLIIIVDSLNTDISYYSRLHEYTNDIIVLDHHDVNESIDYAKEVILVSSQVDYHNKELSGAGVCLQFIRALDEKLGTESAEKLYDLAACGIIADVMSMDQNHMENRAIAYKGFNNPKNLAIKKICSGFGVNSTSISFSVAPLINAAVRMGSNEQALHAMITRDEKELSKYMRVLNKSKKEQGNIVDSITNKLYPILDRDLTDNDKVVIYESYDGENINDLSGLVAMKLADRYGRPAIVVNETKNGLFGSGRGIGINDFKSICENTGIGKFAGHPNAFGVMEIPKDNFTNFVDSVFEQLQDVEFKKTIEVDALIDESDVTTELLNMVKDVDFITGKDFKRLVFAIKTSNFILDDGSIDKNRKHTIITFPNSKLMAIKWNDRSMIEALEEAEMVGDEITLIGNLEFSFIYGNSPKLILTDIIID